jgi:hypothetical protein
MSDAPAAGARFRCETCESEVIVVKPGEQVPSCCGQQMAAR